ncbi:putative ubiquitinyl hydrolase 1 [Helianthus annuus]|uniref:ubiquitinyl hydrolase 1 n=1 Tax=Helianthus annuus TaxID=4232 RepID=A0A251V9S2_HELAN|nr:ubiquitin carboxyl-terminal hydrolase 18 [Helianthus annuus]KAF5815430.1 putative ubiquitinyl hydrolase 1 [Helianthus annuus]KAJ0601952.1 putative ubiquitinyl hydrolase 1 [Helianthus annuus]KAJ0768985.1 putative ubiquitinyl hydrolase 1 [Helianthus annuus]KAJ0936798.1 putative ubiquitinyl hydrolase 1 [Helianthus annuus]KAJ0944696.1 putative ubiquitinyl hydrolase 1 [Helianthus annuus]
MHEYNILDLNWYLRVVITGFVVVCGLIYSVKTAAKYFLVDGDYDSNSNSNSNSNSQSFSESDRGVSRSLSSMMPGLVAVGDSCAVCGSLTSKHCARCKAVRYCSEACQRSHWKSGHKEKCEEFRLSRSSSLEGRRNSTGVALVPGARNTTQIKKILFPYDKFVELFNWKNQSYPPCGLLNCGNSCFANVVLQCLAYTRPLAAYLLEKGHRRGCRRNDWCFLCELQAHMERACQSNHAFSPINILSRLPNIGGNLGYGKQEDAHEFMRFVIDTMQSVCLDEYGGERAVHPSAQETTLIQHIFGGRLQSQVICTKCNNVSNQFENMMDLTVEIQGDAASLEECLDKYTAKEWLEGDNKYKCDGCNDYVLAWKRLNINMAPNILTIALKRFQSGRFGKLNKRVTFPESLDLSPYMSEDADGNDKYKLYAVVVHVDMLNASYFGHYICYTKDFSGNWYRIDDCKVESVELDEVLSQGAYMLLYSRVSARASCLNPIEEASKKDDLQTPDISQEKMPIVTQSVDCSLTSESLDATEKCKTVMHANDSSANISTSQSSSSNSDMDIDTVDSQTGFSVSRENGECSNDRTVAIENETEATVSEDIEGKMGNLSFSLSNGGEANDMDSINLESTPEKPPVRPAVEDESEKPLKTSVSGAKLKPLISSGFLSRRPRKVMVKKDEKALESENGGSKNNNNGILESNTESRVVVNGV